MEMQKTIGKPVEFIGVGLHEGKPAKLLASPAPVGTGIVFRREGVSIPARFDIVDHQPLCTYLVGPNGVSVSTIEHFMAAVWAAGIDNLYVDIDGPELPIMDGSALPFVRGLIVADVVAQARKRRIARAPDQSPGVRVER